MNLLDNPAVQGGLVPLVLALVIGAALGLTRRAGRTPVAWLAVVSGYLASTWLATGIDFTPLSATRKILIIVVVAAIAGLVADLLHKRSSRLDGAFAIGAAVAAAWAFMSIISQREGLAAAGLALGLAGYAAVATWAMIREREDGLRTGAIGVGLGVATGVAAILSASIGFLLSGAAVAAGSGALLLVQVLGRRHLPSGYTGTLGVGVACALFALGAMLLAQMPWYVVVLMLAVPLGTHALDTRALDPARMRPITRASALVAVALVLALIPIAAAWYAASVSTS